MTKRVQAAAGVVAMLYCSTAFAQQAAAPPPNAADDSTVAKTEEPKANKDSATTEIVVTAQRRSEAIERAAVAGLVRAEPDVEELISELGANLRAMLRDVLCGHLEPALRRVADELMAEQPEPVDTLH